MDVDVHLYTQCAIYGRDVPFPQTGENAIDSLNFLDILKADEEVHITNADAYFK